MADQAFEMKDGKFSLFKTESKTKENSPDFTGKGMFQGQEFRLSAWAKTSKDGKVYLQGSIQEPQSSTAPATSAQVDSFIGTSTEPATSNDDLPF